MGGWELTGEGASHDARGGRAPPLHNSYCLVLQGFERLFDAVALGLPLRQALLMLL